MKHLPPILLVAALALAGCNQYSTPAIQSTAPSATAGDGVNSRSSVPLNNQDSPTETTGSVGGSPAGTSSAQTVPSSSNGVR